MTCERARTQLQEQIDGALDSATTRDLQLHVASCASCRGLAADLAAIADAAAALDPIEPPEHVWLQIAGGWRRDHPEQAAGGPGRAGSARRAYTAWHALAAAAVLTVAAGGSWIAWRATDAGAPADTDTAATVLLAKPAASASGTANGQALVESAQNDIEAAEQLYTRAIAGLEQAAAGQRDLLAPEVATALEKNVEIIDDAIVESRAAVKAQPTSVVARESLFEALRKKVALLQNTISLVTEISRGNQAGASRLSGT